MGTSRFKTQLILYLDSGSSIGAVAWMDAMDTVLFADFRIVVFVIIASAIALVLSVLGLATTHRTRLAPMRERDDHKKISSRRADLLDYVARALAVADRRFRDADQLDYVIRRWLFPIPFGEGIRSMPHKEASIGRRGLSDIQDVIGWRLREEYVPERSMPPGLLTFSENLSNEVISPKHLLETAMRARFE